MESEIPMTADNTPTHIAPAQNPRFSEEVRDDESRVLRSSGTWTGYKETTVDVNGYQYVIGGQVAPTPMFFLLSGAHSCTSVTTELASERLDIELNGVHTAALARQDARGLADTAHVQPYYYAVHLELSVGTSTRDEEKLTELVDTTVRTCPALNLLRDANIHLTVNWSFVDQVVQFDAEVRANTAWGYDSKRRPSGRLPEPFMVITREFNAVI